MKVFGKLNILVQNIGLPHKQTPDSTDWLSQVLHSYLGAPQGCVLIPLMFTLYTYDCTPRNGETSLLNFVDDATIIGKNLYDSNDGS